MLFRARRRRAAARGGENPRPSRHLGWANFVGPLSGTVWTRTPSDPCASTKYLARLKVFFDAGMTPR